MDVSRRLKTEADLWKNFRYILEQNNKERLNGEPLSDAEFEQVKNQLQFSSFYKAGEWLVGEMESNGTRTKGYRTVASCCDES